MYYLIDLMNTLEVYFCLKKILLRNCRNADKINKKCAYYKAKGATTSNVSLKPKTDSTYIKSGAKLKQMLIEITRERVCIQFD